MVKYIIRFKYYVKKKGKGSRMGRYHDGISTSQSAPTRHNLAVATNQQNCFPSAKDWGCVKRMGGGVCPEHRVASLTYTKALFHASALRC